MRFDNSDKSFAVKISTLFTILIIGVFSQKGQPSFKNVEQDIINKTENRNPSMMKSFTVKKSNDDGLFTNVNQ